jgi:hypothetical protein
LNFAGAINQFQNRGAFSLSGKTNVREKTSCHATVCATLKDGAQ